MGENLRDLERRVNETEAKLKRYIEFGEKAAYKLGKQVYHSQDSSNIRVKWELKDFYGFYIFFDGGKTMFGGNELMIGYEGNNVLSLDYQSSSDTPEVRVYNPGSWEKIFDRMSRKQQEYINKYKLEKEGQKETLRKAREKKHSDYGRRQELIRRAGKLGLRVSA